MCRCVNKTELLDVGFDVANGLGGDVPRSIFLVDLILTSIFEMWLLSFVFQCVFLVGKNYFIACNQCNVCCIQYRFSIFTTCVRAFSSSDRFCSHSRLSFQSSFHFALFVSSSRCMQVQQVLLNVLCRCTLRQCSENIPLCHIKHKAMLCWRSWFDVSKENFDSMFRFFQADGEKVDSLVCLLIPPKWTWCWCRQCRFMFRALDRIESTAHQHLIVPTRNIAISDSNQQSPS